MSKTKQFKEELDNSWKNEVMPEVTDSFIEYLQSNKNQKEGFVSHSKHSFTIQLIPVFYLIPIKSLYKISQHGLIINDWSITFLCFSFRFIKYKVV